jgi:hypothetical protein
MNFLIKNYISLSCCSLYPLMPLFFLSLVGVSSLAKRSIVTSLLPFPCSSCRNKIQGRRRRRGKIKKRERKTNQIQEKLEAAKGNFSTREINVVSMPPYPCSYKKKKKHQPTNLSPILARATSHVAVVLGGLNVDGHSCEANG